MTRSEQLALDLGQREALGREDFLIADNNALAVDWIDRWPDWPGGMLALYGPAGCGKSHLAHVWCQASDARLVGPQDLLAVEPLRLLAGPASVCCELDPGQLADQAPLQEALLHLYNLVGEKQGSLLLVARSAPARWPVTLPDLRSRLATVTAVSLGPPDEALIAAVMAKLFMDRQLRVPRQVIDYLVKRMERSFATTRALVAAIDAAALENHREITLPLAREVLARLPCGEESPAAPQGGPVGR